MKNKKDFVLSLITSGLEYKEIHDVDIVIEAVYENLELKTSIFKNLDAIVNKSYIGF